MRLIRYAAGTAVRHGVEQGGRVVALADLAPDAPADDLALIAAFPALEGRVRAGFDAAPAVALDAVTLHAPIARPGKIMCIGLNYADHIAEVGMGTPQHQVWFCKQPSAVTAPYGPVQLPRVSQALDYEVELVAVIGRAGRHITRADAPAHVFGYAVGNDVSVRDWQMQTPQWVLGKSFDTHCPFGPGITLAADVPDPHALDITCTVNGQVRQASNTRHLVFDLWDQIAHLSQAMTLEPGDLIFTGTPGGVGLGHKPPLWLAAGDVVRCEIAQLGAIEHVVTPEG